MKNLNKLLLSAALMMISLCGSLQADPVDTFSFSYVLKYDPDTGDVPGEFFGTLTGIEAGGLVTDVVVQEIYLRTFLDPYDVSSAEIITQLTGPFYNLSWNTTTTDWNGYGSAVVAFDGALNNFFFTHDDILAPGWDNDNVTDFAYLLNGGAGSTALAVSIAHDISINDDSGDGEWLLVNLTHLASVPDGGATITLLGLALVGFAALRRHPAAR